MPDDYNSCACQKRKKLAAGHDAGFKSKRRRHSGTQREGELGRRSMPASDGLLSSSMRTLGGVHVPDRTRHNIRAFCLFFRLRVNQQRHMSVRFFVIC